MKSELTKAHNYSLLKGSVLKSFKFILFFSVHVTCQSTAILHSHVFTPSRLLHLFCQTNFKKQECLCLKKKKNKVQQSFID